MGIIKGIASLDFQNIQYIGTVEIGERLKKISV
jgi:hypothetical protein